MNTGLSMAGKKKEVETAGTPLVVLALYEDSETQAWARSVCGHLEQELSQDFAFDCQWYGLDQLADAEAARSATSIATEADLIVFSTRGEARPSPMLEQWVETWAGSKAPQESALVALIAENTNQKRVTPFQAYLHTVAKQARMDFLFHVIRIPSPPLVEVKPGGAVEMRAR